MKQFLQSIWLKYQVFILGLLGAIALALQTALTAHPEATDMKLYMFAAVMAGLSFIASQWRGKGITITGILGVLAGVFVQMNQTGTFFWNQFIIYAVLAVLAAVASPAKPATYETNGVIEQAKEPPKLK